MRFTQFRSFHAVATFGSFTAAAKALNLSQPTVTSQVRGLENRYGLELFHRHGRRTKLTDTGRALHSITNRLFSVDEEAVAFLEAAGQLREGHLKVGAVGPFFVMKILAAFQKAYPGIRQSVSIGNSQEVLNTLLDLQVDVAIFANPQRDPRIYNIAFGEHALVLVLCRAHRWAGRKTIRLTDLDGQPMVLREVGSNTRRAFEAACKEANVQPRVMMEIDSREAMREAIAEGIGLGVIGEQALVPDDRLCTLTFSDAKVTLNRHFACLEERRDAPLVRAFLETSTPFLEGLRNVA